MFRVSSPTHSFPAPFIFVSYPPPKYFVTPSSRPSALLVLLVFFPHPINLTFLLLHVVFSASSCQSFFACFSNLSLFLVYYHVFFSAESSRPSLFLRILSILFSVIMYSLMLFPTFTACNIVSSSKRTPVCRLILTKTQHSYKRRQRDIGTYRQYPPHSDCVTIRIPLSLHFFNRYILL